MVFLPQELHPIRCKRQKRPTISNYTLYIVVKGLSSIFLKKCKKNTAKVIFTFAVGAIHESPVSFIKFYRVIRE